MKKKEDLRITKTRASLYRGLMLLMKKKTFEEIKVSEICAVSFINRSTFYDHFNDKYELLQAMMDDMAIELGNAVGDIQTHSIKEYYAELLHVLLQHIDENKDTYSAVVKINSNSIAKDMITNIIVNNSILEIEKISSNKSNIPIKTYVLFYASGFMNVIMDALEDPKHFQVDSLFQTLMHFIPDDDFFQ